MLDRGERHDKIARELDAHAQRLGGRVGGAASQSGLLQEVPDLVEYPAVVAGTFGAEFLTLPDEVLTTTMIHHQHFFPVVSPAGRLMPAFLAVTNTQADSARTIARNCERVLTARLRDARFFFDADRARGLESAPPALAHRAVPQEARELPLQGRAARAPGALAGGGRVRQARAGRRRPRPPAAWPRPT